MSEKLKILLKFGALVVVSLGIFAVIGSAVLLPQISNSLKISSEQTQEALVEMHLQSITATLNQKQSRLVDIASSEAIISAVLLAEGQNLEMISYLNSVLYRGEALDVIVVNILGEKLHATNDTHKPLNKQEKVLVKHILDGSKPVDIIVNDIAVMIGVPITYGGGIEGVLFGKFPLHQLNFINDDKVSDVYIELTANGNMIALGVKPTANTYQKTGSLDINGMRYNILIDTSVLNEQANRLRNSLLAALIMVIGVSLMLLFILGYKMLVTPYQALDTAQKKLQQKNRDLNEAIVTAEEASAMKGRFLANMSHEIRTPMNGILLSLNLAESTTDTDEIDELISSATLSTTALLEIINDILDFSKLESGKLTIKREPYSVNNVIVSAERLMRPLAEEKGLSFQVSSDVDTKLYFIGDNTRISQVINNLVGNAIKFTSEGSVTLKAQHITEGPQSFLYLEVVDTGTGLRQSEQKQVFQRFKQLDKHMTKTEGTGLGLAISSQLIELMQGEIAVESDGYSGSKFWFRIPVSISDTSVPAVQTKKQETINSHHHILLAEDLPLNQMLISRLLERQGYKVDVVENGKDAFEHVTADHCPYDLVLMDNKMPILNGIDTARAIRASGSKHANIPILALTADALLEQQETFLEAGMNGFIGKPINEQLLQHEIGRVTSEFEHCAKEQCDKEQCDKEKYGKSAAILKSDENHVFRFIYVSEARAPDINYNNLVKKCAAYNQTHNITGILWFIDGYFVQALEGDEKSVAHILGRILLDRRHTILRTLSSSYVKERQFTDQSISMFADPVRAKAYLRQTCGDFKTVEHLHAIELNKAVLSSSNQFFS